MATFHRVKIKIVEGKMVEQAIKTISIPVAEYVEVLRKSYPDAGLIYVEYIDSFDKAVSVDSSESVIILCLNDNR